jgi:hypothetical protein
MATEHSGACILIQNPFEMLGPGAKLRAVKGVSSVGTAQALRFFTPGWFGNRHFPQFLISGFLSQFQPFSTSRIHKPFYCLGLNPTFWSSLIVLTLA